VELTELLVLREIQVVLAAEVELYLHLVLNLEVMVHPVKETQVAQEHHRLLQEDQVEEAAAQVAPEAQVELMLAQVAQLHNG
jgi:hypothetical protein